MRRIVTLTFLLAVSLPPVVMGQSITAQRSNLTTQNSQGGVKSFSPEEVIRQFTKNESALREAWKEYSYQQESRLQVLGPANVVSGEYYQVSDFVFNDAGVRLETIIKAPPSTLDRAGLQMTQEDKNAFINLQPFALGVEDLPNYNVSYVGKEKIDDINAYIFDVVPKVMSNQRELNKLKDKKLEGKYFQGRIWVEEIDLMIVKTSGKVVPEFKQRFAKFETYRENIDGKFWFPTYTYGDDTLQFDYSSAHVRMVIKYKNYKRFQSDVRILTVDEVVDPASAQDKNGTQPANAKPAQSTAKPATEGDPKKKEEKPIRPRP